MARRKKDDPTVKRAATPKRPAGADVTAPAGSTIQGLPPSRVGPSPPGDPTEVEDDPPEQVAKVKGSYTGRYLAPLVKPVRRKAPRKRRIPPISAFRRASP